MSRLSFVCIFSIAHFTENSLKQMCPDDVGGSSHRGVLTYQDPSDPRKADALVVILTLSTPLL